MAVSLDLWPQNVQYDIVQRIQTWKTWRPNGRSRDSVSPDLINTALGGLGLVYWARNSLIAIKSYP